MNNHSADMLKKLGKLNREVTKKKINQDFTISTQNKNEFIIGEEVIKQKIGKEIHLIDEILIGEFVLFDGKICQVTKLFEISNNARLATKFGARNVILQKNCNLFRLLSSHNVGLPVTNDRIGVTVDHISKLNDKQWVLHKNKLAQVTDYNSVNLITDEGIVSVNLNELVLTTIKD
jgi:hypothetical protein